MSQKVMHYELSHGDTCELVRYKMNDNNSNENKYLSIEAKGPLALFSDPLTRLGGEKSTYPIPTYEALCGLLRSVYWKPTFVWAIDAVRIMHKIETVSIITNGVSYNSAKHVPMTATYILNPSYQIKAHIEWNTARPDLYKDRKYVKHMQVAIDAARMGGRMNPFLGTSECPADIRLCEFGSGKSYYDASDQFPLSAMVHSIIYSRDETQVGVRIFNPKMERGIIEFPEPRDCPYVRKGISL